MSRIVFMLATSALLVGLAPVAGAHAAGSTVFTVQDHQRSEFTRDCTKVQPYTCTIVTANSMGVSISVANRPKPAAAITVGYQLVSGTAVAGQDFTGPTSGTVTIPANATSATLWVPLVNDGAAEPAETFTVRLTSASVPGSLTDTGTGTILDGSQIPADCTLTAGLQDGYPVRSLTCTGRPAGQRWVIHQAWLSMAGMESEIGNLVIGNGTSTVYVYLPTAQPPTIWIL